MNYPPIPVNINRIDIEKQWRDTVTVSVGGDVAVIPDKLTLRAGVFYETAVADAAYASVDFSGGPQFGGGAGASLMFGSWKLMLAYQGRVQQAVSVTEDNARLYQQVPGSACIALHVGKLQPELSRAAVARDQRRHVPHGFALRAAGRAISIWAVTCYGGRRP